MQSSLTEDLNRYIIYLRADAEITRIDGQNGWWARRSRDIEAILSGSSSEEELLEHSTALQEIIDQLDASAFNVNGVNVNLRTTDVYNTLETRIDELKNTLTTEKATVDDRIRELSAARGNALRS